MHIIDGEQWLDRKEAGAYLNYAPETLAVYDCTKKHDFKPKMISGRIHYKKSVLTMHLFNQLKDEIL